MNKKVLILSASPRKGGNSDLLCDQFMRGAQESQNSVTKIFVGDKKVGYCRACYFCAKNGGKCAIADDMEEILNLIISSDVIVLASPVYFYSIAAQLKAVIDRTVARWTEIKNKKFFYIATCADEDERACDRTIECFRGFADCVDGAEEIGAICAAGVYKAGEVKNTPAFAEAYRAGKAI